MTTYLGAGYSTWSAETANSDFGQFNGHNSGVPGGIWQVIELGQDIMPTNILTKFDKHLGDHPGIIPVEFSHIPISGSGEEVICRFPYITQCKTVTP